MDGPTILAERRLRDPPVVGTLTTFDADECTPTALRSAAAGFLFTDTNPEQLPYLAQALTQWGAVLSSRVTQTVVEGLLDSGAQDPTAPLVDRLTGSERDIVILVAEGLANTAIGERLHPELGNFRGHLSATFSKLEGAAVSRRLDRRALGAAQAAAHRGQRMSTRHLPTPLLDIALVGIPPADVRPMSRRGAADHGTSP